MKPCAEPENLQLYRAELPVNLSYLTIVQTIMVKIHKHYSVGWPTLRLGSLVPLRLS